MAAAQTQATQVAPIKPGTFLGGPATRAAEASTLPNASAERSQARAIWDSFNAHGPARVSLYVMIAMTIACIVLPWVLPWSSTEVDFEVLAATAPSASHPLGTDAIGRDVLARLVDAGRVSLLIGLAVALISAGAGAFVGTLQGFYGGAVDTRLGWIVNILMTIPSLPLLIAMSSVVNSEGSKAGDLLGAVPAQWRIIIIMSALGWMAISRVVRSQVVSLRGREFVEASIALGATNKRVMVVHILPNTISVLAVFTTLAVATAILGESTLSFLGLGVALPTPTWGNMLLDARDVFTAVQYWWLTWFPAAAILVSVLCVNFIGDGLRDAFDPSRARGR
ncbi:MAG: putative oligopeptide transporter, permease protein AppC [Thermoleophilia bacterium]|nr:putative oligopeptide transporter, permease protein AppC [Thermoleophilia bacterium]